MMFNKKMRDPLSTDNADKSQKMRITGKNAISTENDAIN